MSKITSQKIYAIVLAGGKGKRMNSNTPKVLHKLSGKPMISYTLKTLERLNLSIIVVTGHKSSWLRRALGDRYIYVKQKKLLGTANAVKVAMQVLPQDTKTVLVLNGDDSAFYHLETLKDLISFHTKNHNDLTLLYSCLNNPYGFGRVKLKNKKVKDIVEEKDATSIEKKIKEVSTGTYCFDLAFLKKSIKKVKKNPITYEYYLPQLVEIGLRDGFKMSAKKLSNPSEWLGVNTKKDLQVAQKAMQKNAKEL